MRSAEIRKTFLSFFEERDHLVVPSASLIPDDPTLLFTSAGMVPFKPYFEGSKTPPKPRAASVQKCFRTTDLDLVGSNARHLSFFEMLGNFSFGDYFKPDAIRWAWELVTEGFGLDPDRLWATVYTEDQEAADLWLAHSSIPDERIRRLEDDFWDMGVAGPCGPDSHLYYDRGAEYGPEFVGTGDWDEDRYFEIWNLVFMQNLMDAEGNVVGDLPRQNVDTGMGLERFATVLQGVDTVFDIDTISSLLDVGGKLSGVGYGSDPETDVSLRVIAEHARGMTFALADGVLPSNEHRGYVLRRLIRRSVLHGRKLGMEDPFLVEMARGVTQIYGDHYPELASRRELIEKVLSREESRFDHTLSLGLGMLGEEIEKVVDAGGTSLSGDIAFKLHDTYGFPLDLTEEIATGEGLVVDREGFELNMAEQRERARASKAFGAKTDPSDDGQFEGIGATEFGGYEGLEGEGSITRLATAEDAAETTTLPEGTKGILVTDRTTFYAEAGGQVGDRGEIRTSTGIFRVDDTQRTASGVYVHRGEVLSGHIETSQDATTKVDPEHRVGVTQAHSGTHVLHWALRQFLGDHARQQGSLVEPGRLRFDFSHYEQTSPEELSGIEEEINTKVLRDDPVRAFETTYDEAMQMGAMALFGEKYGDYVRVVEIGDYSRELCGGTHVFQSGQIGVLKIIGEESVAAGTRRVEVLTGMKGLAYLNEQERRLQEISSMLKTEPRAAAERLEKLQRSAGEMEALIAAQRRAGREETLESLLDPESAKAVDGSRIASRALVETSVDELRELATKVRARIDSGVVILGSTNDGKGNIVVAVTSDLVERGVSAKGVIREAAAAIGGGGGGKPELAIAGGPDGSKLESALAMAAAAAESAVRR